MWESEWEGQQVFALAGKEAIWTGLTSTGIRRFSTNVFRIRRNKGPGTRRNSCDSPLIWKCHISVFQSGKPLSFTESPAGVPHQVRWARLSSYLLVFKPQATSQGSCRLPLKCARCLFVLHVGCIEMLVQSEAFNVLLLAACHGQWGYSWGIPSSSGKLSFLNW